MIGRRRVRRTRSGRYELRLPDEERALFGQLVPQMRELLTAGDDSLRRLYPTAYPDDPELDREYQSLVHDDLLARRLAALDVVEATVEETSLDEEGLLTWMGAVNDLRLVLGTRLDVSEHLEPLDPDDADAGLLAVYSYLSWLLEQIVEALEP